MASLSILAVGILIFEYSSNLDALEINIFYILDEVVLLVFAADYFIRFYLADNKKLFFKKNIIDLISIIPFNSIFQAARVLCITKITKLLKILRITKLLRAFIFFENLITEFQLSLKQIIFNMYS